MCGFSLVRRCVDVSVTVPWMRRAWSLCTHDCIKREKYNHPSRMCKKKKKKEKASDLGGQAARQATLRRLFVVVPRR